MVRSWCSLSVLPVDGVDQFEDREAVPRVDRERRAVPEGCSELPVEVGVDAGHEGDLVGVCVGPEPAGNDGSAEPRVAGAHPAGQLALLRVETPGDEAGTRAEHPEARAADGCDGAHPEVAGDAGV